MIYLRPLWCPECKRMRWPGACQHPRQAAVKPTITCPDYHPQIQLIETPGGIVYCGQIVHERHIGVVRVRRCDVRTFLRCMKCLAWLCTSHAERSML